MLPEAVVELVAPHLLLENERDAAVLIPVMSRISGAVMDRIAGLRLIQQWGAGLEGVDIDAATARGIAVANVATTGTGNAESVAEWCVMAAIAASRRLPQLERVIRDGSRWGSLAELPVLLARSDYLFLCLPLTSRPMGLSTPTPWRCSPAKSA
ncbi:MAG: hypothetical protein ACRDQ0_12170 [Pseudonocardia sp.]